eukprot:Pgem_evm1s13099
MLSLNNILLLIITLLLNDVNANPVSCFNGCSEYFHAQALHLQSRLIMKRRCTGQFDISNK